MSLCLWMCLQERIHKKWCQLSMYSRKTVSKWVYRFKHQSDIDNWSLLFTSQGCPIGYAFSATTKTCFMNCVKCNVNESYSSCGSSCEATCSNPTNQGVFCTQNCKEGCFCDKGYVRDVTSGLCVLINNCKSIHWHFNVMLSETLKRLNPTECPDNESWKCGNDLCETTCQTIGQKCTKFPYKCRGLKLCRIFT